MTSRPMIVSVGLAALVVAVAACGSDREGNSSDLLDSIAIESPTAGPTVQPSGPDVFDDLGPGRTSVSIGLVDGTPLDVTIIAPPDWRAGTTTPAVLALPPGDQSLAMVDAVTDRYFDETTAAAGWVVVSPAAPDRARSDAGRLFYENPEPLVELLDLLDGVVVPEGGRWHVAGPSNGGLSAFRFATDETDRVASVIGLPGYPAAPVSGAAVESLIDIPVVLYVGEDDPSWREAMENFAAALREAGGNVTLDVRSGQGHVIGDLSAGELLDVLEGLRL